MAGFSGTGSALERGRQEAEGYFTLPQRQVEQVRVMPESGRRTRYLDKL